MLRVTIIAFKHFDTDETAPLNILIVLKKEHLTF